MWENCSHLTGIASLAVSGCVLYWCSTRRWTDIEWALVHQSTLRKELSADEDARRWNDVEWALVHESTLCRELRAEENAKRFLVQALMTARETNLALCEDCDRLEKKHKDLLYEYERVVKENRRLCDEMESCVEDDATDTTASQPATGTLVHTESTVMQDLRAENKELWSTIMSLRIENWMLHRNQNNHVYYLENETDIDEALRYISAEQDRILKTFAEPPSQVTGGLQASQDGAQDHKADDGRGEPVGENDVVRVGHVDGVA